MDPLLSDTDLVWVLNSPVLFAAEVCHVRMLQPWPGNLCLENSTQYQRLLHRTQWSSVSDGLWKDGLWSTKTNLAHDAAMFLDTQLRLSSWFYAKC